MTKTSESVWERKAVPASFWSRKENRRDYLLWLGKKLGFSKPEDWYGLQKEDLVFFSGRGVLKHYATVQDLLKDLLPNHDWKEWLFPFTSHEFWEIRAHRRRYLAWLGERLGYEEPQDWYQIQRRTIAENHGRGLLDYYDRRSQFTLFAAAREHAPGYPFKEWLFTKVPRGFWEDPANQRRYLDWFAEEHGLERLEDWYQVQAVDLLKCHGQMVLKEFRSSQVALLRAHFPDHDWKDWLFPNLPRLFWDDPQNVLDYFDWLGDRLGYEKPEDWYQLTATTVREHGGDLLLKKLGGTCELVRFCLPDHEWLEWRFPMVPASFWRRRENVVRYLEWLGQELGFRKPEDWYQVTRECFNENHGATLYARHGGSASIVMKAFPDYDWLPWLFSPPPPGYFAKAAHRRRYQEWAESPAAQSVEPVWELGMVPPGFWRREENQRAYFQWLQKKLGIRKPEDWYRVSRPDLGPFARSTVLSEYGDSVVNLVRHFLPEVPWKEWFFSSVPHGFWQKKENRRRYLDWLGAELGYEKPEDWYQLRKKTLEENHGQTLLSRIYRYSVIDMVREHIPDYDWQEWRFGRAPKGFWKKPANRRRYLAWLGEELGYERPQDWYGLRTSEVRERHGSALLVMYNGSPASIVADNFPKYDWKEWMFNPTPKCFWDEPANILRYFKWLGKELGFKKPEDWHRLTTTDLLVNHGNALVVRFGSGQSFVEFCLSELDGR